MSLRYEWSFDVAQIGALAFKLTDDEVSATERRITSGTYAHTSIASVESGYTAFSAALKSALDTGHATTSYTVTWAAATGYTITYSGVGNVTLAFSTVGTVAEGTRLRQILGMSGDRSGAKTYASQVRPYYLILPAIQGRTQVDEDYEPEGIMREVVTDDGSVSQVSKETGDDADDLDGDIWIDWIQGGENSTGPATAFADGTLVYKKHATSPAPWTYQHAWKHARRGRHPFLCVDGSESSVCMFREEGSSFHPTRFAAQDYPLWSIPFRVHLLGRL